MNLYTPWFPPPGGDGERPPVLVRDGFSWWGLVFGWLALLRPGSWLCAALVLLCSVAAALVSRHLAGGWAMLAGIHLAVGCFAADWRAWELKQGGFSAGPIVAGADPAQALLRLLDQRPELVGRPAPAAAA